MLKDPGIAQWYARKVARDGGKKGKALVAIMRKVAAGINHCARTGEEFQVGRVFQEVKTGRRKNSRAVAAAKSK